MPKRRTVKTIKKSATKKVTSKSATSPRKTTTKSTHGAPLKSATKKKAAAPTVKNVPILQVATKSKTPKSPPATPTASSNSEVHLGRPLVTQEEKLYMLFHDDYLARQVFEFLRVDTVKELEQFSQQQIVHLMSKPLRMTIDRIRQRLAQFKRSLKDDEHFAAEFLKQNK